MISSVYAEASASRLRAENARLIALLEAHGINWQDRAAYPELRAVPEPAPSKLSPTEKIALFRRLFRGRTDVFPVRWEGKTSGKSGYAPACANEWRAGICEKPRIKCSECGHRQFVPLSDGVFFEHLSGLEISRSGKGAHAWIFFASPVHARDARRFGTAIISHTCARTRQLKLTSYDRLFPNQDTRRHINGKGPLSVRRFS